MPNPPIKYHLLPWVDSSKTFTPTCVVLHWWGEPINDQGIEYLCSLLEKSRLSVQFSVLANGDIYQLVPNPDTFCHHAKCANQSSIGIEIEGLGREDLDANTKQFEALVSLVDWLVQKYNMKSEFKVEGSGKDTRFFGITSHKNVDLYCPNSNGKDDVHDQYVSRVIKAL